ncbi:sulfite exporter TauE/SafE family protein [Jeotgalibacillus salarius]|uniref:Probable membrane transporter protein n=1 Tax=Jeotgalibacillus salarius TaxID=546023 RepID=A0A4Y8LIT0_9BACL|nr:sulfite exporter TauE/SafE family protein [Jeotgalibacillus salarius]TFE01601.1 sulfite exporter TauE/SafE family protein [Jeotgalibacillus salarius]
MDIVLFVFIILFASILQTSTGFGFSIMATPFLLLLFNPIEAIRINLILSIVISLAMIRAVHRDIDHNLLKRFSLGSIAGLPIGILVLLFIDMDSLKIGIGLLVLSLTFMLVIRLRITRTAKRDITAGGMSGALTSSIGMPGPPLLLYLSGTDTDKAKLRSTTLAFYLLIYSISLAVQIATVGTTTETWILSLYGLPLVFAGLWAGQKLYHIINQQQFRFVTYIILVFTGLYLLFGNI